MREEIIEILRDRNDYVSGEEIGNRLGISRAAVWKNIKALKEKGYVIESVSNKGYKISDSTDVLNESDIDYDKILYKAEIGSTNEEGKRQAAMGCENGLLILCDNQTAGKGRLGRSWIGEKNAGIYMSIVIYPDIMPTDIPQITLVTGIAVMRALNAVTELNMKIKWPNDIIVNGKKLVGILSEMSAEMEKVNYVVIGVGINVNMKNFEGELKEKATSIYIETGKKFKRSDIINRFVKEFKICYNKFCENGFAPFVNEYNENCANLGKEVKTVGGRISAEGIAKGVNEKGELLIETDRGLSAIMAGEVSIRLSNGKYI